MQYRHITLSDRKVIQKRLNQGKNQKDNKKLFRHVLLKLMLRWSPEQIAGRLKSFADPDSPSEDLALQKLNPQIVINVEKAIKSGKASNNRSGKS